MADFPERGRSGSSAETVGTIIGVLLIAAYVVSWVFAIASMIHGTATHDLWEVVKGFVTAIILAIIWWVLRGLQG